MVNDDKQFNSSQEFTNNSEYDVLYLKILFKKLQTELLKLEINQDKEAFKNNCLELLEQIKKELYV